MSERFSSGAEVDRPSMDLDIACVGFGPATAGFLAVLSKSVLNADGSTAIESRVAPGMPLQVACYERADDLAFGVSGVVTRARGIKATLPDLDLCAIPMAVPVASEKIVYLLDPHGASRRSATLRLGDRLLRCLRLHKHDGVELPYVPPFLRKQGGMVLSLGQFMQFVGGEITATGAAQIWPGMPVSEVLFADDESVAGIRLADQGVDRTGLPQGDFLPGMNVHAGLTVVGDGPVGNVGRQLDRKFGLPPGNHHREWAVGMKMVVDLPQDTSLIPGAVFHTFGYPEPEIFGFLYVHPGNVATVGIFVPSWFSNPLRTSYRYLQHFMHIPTSAVIWRAALCGVGAPNRCRNRASEANRSSSGMAMRASAKAPAAPMF